MNKLCEQFDVLSNTLRLMPEEILRLNYFVKTIKDPEEGISNIEISCVNIFNNIYGMMCALKEEKIVESIYDHEAITTILCIRHVLQHQPGRLKNNLRDALMNQVSGNPVLVRYNALVDSPFCLNVSWFQKGIALSNNAKKLPIINEFWSLDIIKVEIDLLPNSCWESVYISVVDLIAESVRTIVVNYGEFISPAGFDSNVYLEHFRSVLPINPKEYKIAVGPSNEIRK